MEGFPSLGDALAWLDGHQNLERMQASVESGRPVPPDLGRMRELADVLGHPEAAEPVIHITGTNGKTSTTRAVAALLEAKGLRTGTFTSPHLETINERITTAGAAIDDRSLCEVLSELAGVEPMVAKAAGRPTWFELLTAAAMLWFADRPVDVAVFEVGMGGRWDATNIVESAVSVVTNVGLDHVEFLGPTRADIAAEKAGVVRPAGTLVLGETDPELVPIFEREGPADLWLAGRDFGCSRNDMAVGGRLLDLRTPAGRYEEVWMGLHGAHQGDNFVLALAATEAFFGAPLEEDLVRQAAGALTSPGRLEVVRQSPLVVLDGAKNIDGARASGTAVAEEFGDRPLIVVAGMLRGKDPLEMLEALGAGRARLVVACSAPSPRSQAPGEICQAAERLGAPAVEAPGVEEALESALSAAGEDDLVLVTGSLYVVGAARRVLGVR